MTTICFVCFTKGVSENVNFTYKEKNRHAYQKFKNIMILRWKKNVEIWLDNKVL